MCKLREAAEQALEALCDFDYDKRIAAVEALREVLEKKEPECVAVIDVSPKGWEVNHPGLKAGA